MSERDKLVIEMLDYLKEAEVTDLRMQRKILSRAYTTVCKKMKEETEE